MGSFPGKRHGRFIHQGSKPQADPSQALLLNLGLNSIGYCKHYWIFYWDFYWVLHVSHSTAKLNREKSIEYSLVFNNQLNWAQGSQLVGDNNRTDVEDCRSFCQGQSGAAFFTFNEKRKSCGCRATKGESENARGTQSGMIFDQPKLHIVGMAKIGG